LGQTTTGNGLQYTTAWAPALDIGSSAQQGLPFVVEGAIGNVVDIPWLSENPTSGSFMGTDPVAVTFDPTGLPVGLYYAALGIESNDPDEPFYFVPVTMTVIDYAPGVALEPPADSLSGNPGVVVQYTLDITNTGNAEDTFALTAAGNAWGVSLSITEVTLLPGASASFTVDVTIPANAQGGDMDVVTIAATSGIDPLVSDSSVLTTYANAVYGFELGPAAQDGYGDPGAVVQYTLQLTNTSNTTDTFDFTYSGNLWTVALPVTSFELAAGETVDVIVNVTVPAGAQAGDFDVAQVQATSTATSDMLEVEVTTHANTVYAVELTPATDALTDTAGTTVAYTLHLVNMGNITDTFTFVYAGNTWVVGMPVMSFELAAGEAVDVVVNVTIPAGAADGDFDVVTVTVTSTGDGAVTASSELTTTASVEGPTFEMIYLPIIFK
jgi:hypothetical protein